MALYRSGSVPGRRAGRSAGSARSCPSRKHFRPHQHLLLGLNCTLARSTSRLVPTPASWESVACRSTSSSAVSSACALAICAWSASAARYCVPTASTTLPRVFSVFSATTFAASCRRVQIEVRKVEQHLVRAQLRRGRVHLHDRVKQARREAERRERRRLESQCGQVDLFGAGVSVAFMLGNR